LIDEARRGQLEIVVSMFAAVEVAKLSSPSTEDDERAIVGFFNQPYIVRANLDFETASIARLLIRRYPRSGKFRGVLPKDAVHVATSLRWNIPVFETFDRNLIDGITAQQHLLPRALQLREPLFEGQGRMDDILPIQS
jgi:predicted nucleic acid-binding protein